MAFLFGVAEGERTIISQTPHIHTHRHTDTQTHRHRHTHMHNFCGRFSVNWDPILIVGLKFEIYKSFLRQKSFLYLKEVVNMTLEQMKR